MATNVTSQERTNILKLVAGMFNAVPGATYLEEFTTSFLALNKDYGALATALGNTGAFKSLYPSSLTVEETATKFLTTLGLAANTEAQDFVQAKLNAGESIASVIFQSLVALVESTSTDPQIVAAQAQLTNKAAVAEYYSVTLGASSDSLATLQGVIAKVTSDAASVEAAKEGSAGANGQTYMLTKGLDNYQGTSGNDTIIGSISGDAELKTLSALDIINGGAGIDTLKISDDVGTAIALPSMSGVEVVEVSGTKAVSINTSAVADVTNLDIIKAGTSVAATASATADIKVEMKQGTAAVVTGAGPNDTYANVAVNGGKNVTVNLTDVKQVIGDDTGTPELNAIVIGGTTAAKGDVSVSSTGVKADGANDVTLSTITVNGGKTVTVTQKATSDASAAATDKTTDGGTPPVVNHKVVQGAVTVNGNADTTTVTVKQDAAVAAKQAVDAVANKDATQVITFKALAKGEKIGLSDGTNTITFTASKALTAAEVASAFANLSKNALQGNASAKLGEYTTTTAKGLEKWFSGAVEVVDADNAKVTFSGTGAEATTLVDSSSTSGKVTIGSKVAGTNKADAVTGVLGVDTGVVTITDTSAAHDALKTITVDGYANNSVIGSGANVTTALNNLTLKNAQGTAKMTVADTAATLDLTVEKLGAAAVLNAKTGAVTTAAVEAVVELTTAPTTLNVKSVGNNSIDFKAAATETLNVSGTGTLKLDEASANDLGGLKSIKVTETAGLTLNHNAGTTNAITSVDTTGTTGTTTITILGDKATYAGGAGVDNVTIGNAGTAISKSVSLGGGDDKLTLVGAVATPTANLDGGTGTNTIAMNNASAVDVTKNGNFAAKIDNFQKLEITDKQTTAGTINLANLDNINYVISKGSDSATAAATKTTFTLDVSAATATNTDTVVFTYAPATTKTYTFTGTIANATPFATTLYGLILADQPNSGGSGWVATGVSGSKITFEAATAGALATPAAGAFVFNDVDGGTSGAATFATTQVTAGANQGSAVLAQTIDKMASGGTLELVGASAGVIVQVTDATTGTADVLNIVANAADAANLGKVVANKVETINVEAKDTITGTDVSTNTLQIDGDKATTVNVKGAGNLTLTFSADSKALTLVDGSTATGKLNITSVKNDGENLVIKGGLGDDTLTSAGQNDKLFGGDGKDTLKAAGTIALVELSGGAGIDSFDVSLAQSKTAASVVRITDFAVGETIKFSAGADASFLGTKFEMTGAAGLSDYVGQALAAADAYAETLKGGAADKGIAWFQFGTNTYIVQDVDGNGAFTAGQDIVVELTGLVDLSASSFNDNGNGTLLFI